jgi:RNA polymerase sigma-70 factor (ECF subfamily)
MCAATAAASPIALPSCLAAPAAPDWAALVAHRAPLVRFARRRLADPALAEDLVHDVFEAVASGRARFDGRASLRTWLTAILKHKLVDHLRAQRGHASLDEGWDDNDDAGSAAIEPQCPQPRPDERAALRQRLARALARIEALPETLREAFVRRVIADEESDEICHALGISPNNLFVRLHRARAMLAA